MKKTALGLLLFVLLLSMTGCKSGKDSIAANEDLTRILASGAAGSGKGADDQVADLPDVDSANMRSNTTEGVTYFKLVDSVETVVDPGTYTVGMADEACTVKVMDPDGKVVQTVTIGAQGDGSKGVIKPAANITVPEGGSAISVGGTCIAQKN